MFKKFLGIIFEEKQLVTNSLMLGISISVSGFLGLATTILVSRILGPQNFGIFKTLTAIYGFFIGIFDFGCQNTLAKYISEFSTKKEEFKIRHLTQNIFLLRVVILIFVLIFLIPLSIIFKDQISLIFLKDEKISFLIYPATIYFIISFLDLTKPILTGLQNFKLISITNILASLSVLVVTTSFAYLGGLPLAIISLGIAHFIGSLAAIIFLFKKKIHKETKHSIFVWPQQISDYGIPSYFSNFPSYIFLAIIPLLSLFFNQTKVGYFAFSLSFYTSAMIIPGAVSVVLFPKIASLALQNVAKAQKTLKRTLALYSAVGILEIAATFLIAKPFVAFFVPQFLPAVGLVKTLIVTGVILGFGTLMVSYLNARHKLRISFILQLFLAFVFIFVSFFATKNIL